MTFLPLTNSNAVQILLYLSILLFILHTMNLSTGAHHLAGTSFRAYQGCQDCTTSHLCKTAYVQEILFNVALTVR